MDSDGFFVTFSTFRTKNIFLGKSILGADKILFCKWFNFSTSTSLSFRIEDDSRPTQVYLLFSFLLLLCLSLSCFNSLSMLLTLPYIDVFKFRLCSITFDNNSSCAFCLFKALLPGFEPQTSTLTVSATTL